MVLYRNQLPINFVLHFAELHILVVISDSKILCLEIIFKCYIVIGILISFNYFSDKITCKDPPLECEKITDHHDMIVNLTLKTPPII